MAKRGILGLGLVFAMAGSSVLADSINFIPITGTDTVGYNYQIAETEITVEQFTASGVGSGGEDYWSSLGANAPASFVSYVEAARFCNWLTTTNPDLGAYTIIGGMVTAIDRTYDTGGGPLYVLPTVAEFDNAAYYNLGDSTYHTYALDPDVQPTTLQTRYLSQTSPWIVGSGAQEQNGTRDMMGNVYEWLEGSLVKGGAYNSTIAQEIRYNQAAVALGQTSAYDTIGFRPVAIAIPEPGTMSMMGLSTIGLFFTRTIRRRKLLGRTLMPIRREHSCDVFDDGTWANVADEEGVDYLSVLLISVKTGCLNLWAVIHQVYMSVDKAFWNRMVAMHERKVARRTAMKRAVRKKALDAFDAFLAIVMK